jgi:uncharacterized membrane protein
MKYLGMYVVSFLFFCVIDMLFLKFVMGPMYLKSYPHLLRMVGGDFKINIAAALACYMLIVFSVIYFVYPLAENSSWFAIWLKGFILGVALYGVFDLTNMAIMQNWNLWVSLLEIIWGGVICSITSLFFVFCFRMWME